ncbi:MAG: transposase zinc-binding domain-containing protein [Luteolibacter sp.]|nr:transposase zinc-binding domain-containing protein [Luteolibacter sp.]
MCVFSRVNDRSSNFPGGHIHACGSCATREFHFHSCKHRSCPQCGKDATAEWVERELGKRVGAPCFMVTFTLRAIRHYGFCHPAAKAKRERIAFHTGRPLLVGATVVAAPVKPPHVVSCPCCGEPMKKLLRLLPAWSPSRAPPPPKKRSCA